MAAVRKYALLGLAAVVIAAVVILVVLLRSDSQAERTGAEPSASRPGGVATPAPRSPHPDRPQLDVADRQPGDTDDPDPDPSGTPREYIRPDGIVVRDHRTRGQPPDLTRAVSRPHSLAKVSSKTVLAVRQQLLPIASKCSEGMDFSGMPEDAVVGVRSDLILRVESQQLTVDGVTVVPLNVPEHLHEPMQSCMAGQIESLVVAADGEKDVADYTVSIHTRLRR